MWKEWDMNTNIWTYREKQLTHKEKQWIWKHVCFIGNINQIKKWDKLNVVWVRWKWYLILSMWNYGLVKACQCGNIDLVNLMIEKGADDWNWGLECACRSGKRELADLMIEKGANNGDLINKYLIKR